MGKSFLESTIKEAAKNAGISDKTYNKAKKVVKKSTSKVAESVGKKVVKSVKDFMNVDETILSGYSHKYVVRYRNYGLLDGREIKNENNIVLYHAKPKSFWFHHNFNILDANNEIVGSIHMPLATVSCIDNLCSCRECYIKIGKKEYSIQYMKDLGERDHELSFSIRGYKVESISFGSYALIKKKEMRAILNRNVSLTGMGALELYLNECEKEEEKMFSCIALAFDIFKSNMLSNS